LKDPTRLIDQKTILVLVHDVGVMLMKGDVFTATNFVQRMYGHPAIESGKMPQTPGVCPLQALMPWFQVR
jgi:hypothetical protein